MVFSSKDFNVFSGFLMFLMIVLVLARFEYFVRPSVRQKSKDGVLDLNIR
jgi:hypothetical protein